MSQSPRLKRLAEAFQELTYREMKDLASVLVETLSAINGLQVKPEVMADMLDSFDAYLTIETEEDD